MTTVCIVSGTAINRICIGFDKITSVCEAKIKTSVRSNPMIVALSNLWMNVFSKYSKSFFPISTTGSAGGLHTG